MVNEKRMIDANELKGIIQEVIEESDSQLFKDVMRKVCDILDKSPTVDAVEVVRSQWDTVFYERNGTLASYSHLCPVCKYFYRDVKFKGHNYCPNCGAKMDGERKANCEIAEIVENCEDCGFCDKT